MNAKPRKFRRKLLRFLIRLGGPGGKKIGAAIGLEFHPVATSGSCRVAFRTGAVCPAKAPDHFRNLTPRASIFCSLASGTCRHQ